MGCTNSNMRRTASRFDKADEVMLTSPSLSSSFSDVPVILESPTASTGYSQMPTNIDTPPSLQPPRRRLHPRRRQEPHLDHHLSDRLEMLARYLQRASPIDRHDFLRTQTQCAINDLLENIHSFFLAYESEKRPLWRLAQTGRVVQQVERFHRSLDAITSRCGLAVVAPSGAGPSLPRWQARWRRMRAERLVFFRSYLLDHEADAVSSSRVREPSDQVELLTLLKHDAQKFDTLLTLDELELLKRTFTFVATWCNNNMNVQLHTMVLPEWFVAPYDRSKQQLKWQRAVVTVQKAPRSMSSQDCFTLASTWSRLQHLHIMKLFGACHVGRRPFFVMAKGTPLTLCFGHDDFPLWRAFHEAALALSYLHERRIGLDGLSCADLVLFRNGDQDTAMLSGFNFRKMKALMASIDPMLEDESDSSIDDVDTISPEHEVPSRLESSRIEDYEGAPKKCWKAPELLHGAKAPTGESDIFALGICVVEAFSGGNVQILNDSMPRRPAALADASQWALVERMCSLDPKGRPSLNKVLASFQVFAEDETKARADFTSSMRRKKPLHQFLRQTQPRATSASIARTLREVQAWCDEASESSALNYQLYERMNDLASRLEMLDTDERSTFFAILAELILRFRDFLQRRVNEKPLLRLAATRHVIELNMEFHSELDVLMDKLALDRSGASIHSWKSQQASHSEQLWRRLRLLLTMDSQTLSVALDGEGELAFLGYLLSFEAKKRSSRYAAQDLELLQSSLARVEEAKQLIMPRPAPGFRTTESKSMLALPMWFIPPYEVVFNVLDTFSRGAFGSVHFGKWLGSDVVVEKMVRCGRVPKSNANQSDRFVEEVSLWSNLKHPHVLKLFGACHLGAQQFLLCEYASQGSIDSYVASKSGDERGVFARRVLHEAALGLHYLHTQNVVHADLRCSNILVDSRGLVKLTNFGVSSRKNFWPVGTTIISDNNTSDPCRWVPPECLLTGETPTFASNVYSFAMCAIEVMSGELPWGCEMADAAVRSKVRNRLMPPRPANCFSDSEWNLVERMCCHDPSERISMSEVVRLLA